MSVAVAICLKNISFVSKALSLQYSYDEFGVSVMGCQTPHCTSAEECIGTSGDILMLA